MVVYIIMAIIAYLIGSINFSVILSKKMAGFDVREKGSGNAGSTNMLRSVGKKAAAITLICDILKGVVSIGIAILLGNVIENMNRELLLQIAGIAVVIGHTFPIFFGFKGGKGVATSLGVILMEYGRCGEDDLNRYISDKTCAMKDARALLAECADDKFLEIRPDYAPEMVTGFLTLNGILVGAVANAECHFMMKKVRRLQIWLTVLR